MFFFFDIVPFGFYVAELVVQREVPDAKGKLASLLPKIIGNFISDLIHSIFTVKYCVWSCKPH